MESVAVVLKYIINKLLHGGDSSLRSYEVATLQALRECLNEENTQKFDKQLEKLTKVQRWQDGKTSAFFDYKDEMKDQWPRKIAFFDTEEKDGMVAKLSLSIGGKKVTAKIEFYKGYLLYIKYTYEMGLLEKPYKVKVCTIGEVFKCKLDQDIVVKSASLLKEQ